MLVSGGNANELMDQRDLLVTQRANMDRSMTLRGDISALEDVDLPSTLIDLQAQEIAYQVALGATGRVLQPTLMAYIR